MNMTIDTNHAGQLAPHALVLKDGESTTVVLPSSASPTGTATVTLKRMTESYFNLSLSALPNNLFENSETGD